MSAVAISEAAFPSVFHLPLLPSTGNGGRALLVAATCELEYTECVVAVGTGDTVLAVGSMALVDSLRKAVGPTGRIIAGDVRRKGSGKASTALATDDEAAAAGCVHFVEIDSAWDLVGPAVRPLLGDGPTVVFLDHAAMNGNDLLIDVMAVVSMLRGAFSSTLRLIVAKSLVLAGHSYAVASAAQLLSNADVRAAWAAEDTHGDRQTCSTKLAMQVIGAVQVDQYRACIPLVVRPGDRVLEIGCHLVSVLLIHLCIFSHCNRLCSTDQRC
jgi:hypothetical protein